MSTRYKKEKYESMVSDSPLRSSLINDGGRLSKISECKKDALSKNFRNDGISHSNIVKFLVFV